MAMSRMSVKSFLISVIDAIAHPQAGSDPLESEQ